MRTIKIDIADEIIGVCGSEETLSDVSSDLFS